MPMIPVNYQALAEELNDYLKKAEDYRGSKVERSFIDWYIKARFGASQDFKVTDGAKDGGIDAIGKDDQTVIFLQMKYGTRPRSSTLTSDEVADFERVHDSFENDENFEQFISSVRSELVPIYRKAYSEIKNKKNRVYKSRI